MSKIIVVGDVHGDLNQLLYPLIEFFRAEREETDDKNKYRKLIYLGDYIDRGESNVFIWLVIRWVMSLEAYKDRIVFLRGNHECYCETVFDYYGESVNSKRFTVSLVFDEMNSIPFKIVHYDEKTNILFSHSPLSRPLKDALKLNDVPLSSPKNGDNTYTNDAEHAKMEYKNIHGHIHRMSKNEVLEKFFRGEGLDLSPLFNCFAKIWQKFELHAFFLKQNA